MKPGDLIVVTVPVMLMIQVDESEECEDVWSDEHIEVKEVGMTIASNVTLGDSGFSYYLFPVQLGWVMDGGKSTTMVKAFNERKHSTR